MLWFGLSFWNKGGGRKGESKEEYQWICRYLPAEPGSPGRMEPGKRCPDFPLVPSSDLPLCLLLAELTGSPESKGASRCDPFKVSPEGHRAWWTRVETGSGACWVDWGILPSPFLFFFHIISSINPEHFILHICSFCHQPAYFNTDI